MCWKLSERNLQTYRGLYVEKLLLLNTVEVLNHIHVHEKAYEHVFKVVLIMNMGLVFSWE